MHNGLYDERERGIDHCYEERPILVETPLEPMMFKGFFGAWLLKKAPGFLVDAGPARAAEHLISSLRRLGLERLDYLLLTHIHLDHAGGVKRVLEEYPEARVICHRSALPHLVEPARLWAGSLKVLG
ncbi:MAG: MBL fold metallo-hydrolase, partial [Desulfobacteraceae bacterium]